ncbi:MAG: hypothetical protein OXU79_18410 [Gemmatimonadota bacterium]|nr:hypothetical protein [Gemmatimonadota bacterium]
MPVSFVEGVLPIGLPFEISDNASLPVPGDGQNDASAGTAILKGRPGWRHYPIAWVSGIGYNKERELMYVKREIRDDTRRAPVITASRPWDSGTLYRVRQEAR